MKQKETKVENKNNIWSKIKKVLKKKGIKGKDKFYIKNLQDLTLQIKISKVKNKN